MKRIANLSRLVLVAAACCVAASAGAQPDRDRDRNRDRDRGRDRGGNYERDRRGTFEHFGLKRVALEHLDDARDYLEAASRDKGGHRKRAEELVRRCMRELWDDTRGDHRRFGNRDDDRFRGRDHGSLDGFLRGRRDRSLSRYRGPRERQPLMREALACLNRAEETLRRTDRDRRETRQALRLINEAQEEIQKGIRFDREQ